MNREEFIEYLVDNGCEIVRIANQGYHVMRNVATRAMSGLPETDPPLAATVCRICKSLGVPTPPDFNSAQEIIDHIHQEFQHNQFNPEPEN